MPPSPADRRRPLPAPPIRAAGRSAARLALAFAALLGLAVPALAAPVAVPPLAFTGRTLANGLRVYALPDRGGSTVSVQVWYDVGSKDDPRGRSGFAHLFEHLMFKATRNMAAETLDRLTEDVGGSNNASTDDDYTEYHETVPANHLERLLWAEAERMSGLVVDQANFTSERLVVEEELRNGLARPYGRLFQTDVPAASYRISPYARGTIGSIENLDAATLGDVRAFHAIHYRPDNAVLVVSGNFDPAQLDRWVDRYFGGIARPAWPNDHAAAIEPARTGPARFVDRVANTPLPAVVLNWLMPPSADPDHAVLSVIDALLSGGDSARLHQDLVYRDRIASEADVQTDFKRGTGTFNAFVVMASGHDAAAGEAALRREVARLRDAPVAAAELARVRNQIVTSALKQRETAEGRASLVASGTILDGDPGAADKRLAAVQRVTAADVQRVARKLLADDRAVAIYYLPPAAPAAAGDRIALAATVVTKPLVAPPSVPVTVAAAPGARAAPPAPGPAVTPALPTPVERRLANGLRIVILERHALPIVTAHLVARRGGGDDPKGRAGLAELAADVLTKGTATRSATEIAEQVESLGGAIGGDAGRDGATLTLTVKADELDRALPVFADVALHPAFKDEELDRARAEMLDDVVQRFGNPAALGGLVGGRLVYGDGPYGPPEDGTPASLKAITRDDLVASHAATWRPDTTTLVLAGDITADRAEALAKRLFGGWRAPAAAPVPMAKAAALPAPRFVVVDMADAPQAAVLIARATITRGDPDYYPMLVANTALGGGYSSRLNREVRVKRGLAYGAGSSFRAGRLPGPLSVATQTKDATVADVIRIMQAEMKGMATAPLPADELAARKAVLSGGFGEAIETTDGLAGIAAGLVQQEVPLAELRDYSGEVQAVAPAEVQRVAAKLMDPALASVVVVGDARRFVPALKAAGFAPEVIPVAALDLDKAGLR